MRMSIKQGYASSATPRPDMTQKAAIHVTYSNKNNNTADDVAWLPHHNNGNFHFSPSNETKPTQARTKNSPLFESTSKHFHLPKAQARRFHPAPTLHHRPARSPFLLVRLSRPKKSPTF